MKTIGIDLSLTGTGLVVLKDGEIELVTTIKSKPIGSKPSEEVRRMQDIADQIYSIVDDYVPDLVALEGIAFMSKNSTALAQLSGLTYMVRADLLMDRIPFVVVAPTSLKKFATGSGTSPKEMILLEVYKRYGVSVDDNNQADAYILAQVAEAVLAKNVEVPKFQQEVIDLIKPQV